jgi:hypothetical protein
MLVKILKPFPCAVDAGGVAWRDLVADAVEEVRDDLVPGLVAEGYVTESDGGREVAGVQRDEPLAGAGEAIQEPTADLSTGEAMAPIAETNPFDHDGDGKAGGAPKGGNRKKAKA